LRRRNGEPLRSRGKLAEIAVPASVKAERKEIIMNKNEKDEGVLEIDYSKIDYTKLDYTKLNPDKIPSDVVQHTTHFGGLMSETQTLRLDKQRLIESNEALMSELKSKDDTEDDDLDEPVTRGDLQKTLSTFEEKQKAKNDKNREEQESCRRADIQSASLANLRKSTKDAPPGLDADTVIRKAGAWLSQNKKHLLKAALDSNDPGSELYELGLTYVPELRKISETAKHSIIIEDLKKNKGKLGTGSTFGESSENELLDLLEKPEDELLAMIQEEETT